jgi:UDP-N-acetylmuramoyl-tripeptide--D-alanyl-D-alanine ligase
METRMMGPVRVLFDGYNANPASMRAALRLLASLPGRRLAVLGEMRELGTIRDRAHAEVAREAVALLGPDRVFLLGDVWPAEATDGARLAPDLRSLGEAVRAVLREGDTLLVKASRGVGLERLLPLVFPDAPSGSSH